MDVDGEKRKQEFGQRWGKNYKLNFRLWSKDFLRPVLSQGEIPVVWLLRRKRSGTNMIKLGWEFLSFPKIVTEKWMCLLNFVSSLDPKFITHPII